MIKEFNPTNQNEAIEKALAMYMETVSPSTHALVNVLNQIPEIKEDVQNGQAIRSPYIWLRVGQIFSTTVVAIALLISIPSSILTKNSKISKVENSNKVEEISEAESNPFYEVDNQIAKFEQDIHDEDYKNLINDYTL